jgi:4'-phosphopantetheinyl transferase
MTREAWSGYHVAAARPNLAGGLPRPVSVFCCAAHEAHGAAEAWLSTAETARLASMQHPRARAEFLTGRWLLRGLLGSLLAVAPADVPLEVRPHGGLRVSGHPRLGVNLSHTPGLVAVALARDAEVGVDVEWTARPGRTVELAHRWFASSELAALTALPEADQRTRFFELWTLKEAYIKARGLGLRVPLGSFAFAFGPEGPRLSLTPEAGDVLGLEPWRAVSEAVGASHRLGLVWRPAR